MSHFTVAVITAKKEKLEEMLAPYDEGLEVEPYIERTKKEIIKKARKWKEDFLKEQKEGKKLSDWELKYINAKTDEELYQTEIDEYEQYDEERK
jgi:Zn-dependent oligopeptidase